MHSQINPSPRSTFCTSCGMLNIAGHVCPPEWLVWDREDEDGKHAIAVFAYDAQEAAELWPGESPDAQARLGSGTTIDVLVRRVGTERVEPFTVSGVTTPAYMAKPTRASEVPRG